METLIVGHEGGIRLGLFLGILVVIALWEALAPRRALTVPKAVRWANNLGLVALNTLVLRLLFPAAAVGMAAFAAEQGWGLLHRFALPFGLAVVLAVVALDFVIWVQHVLVLGLVAEGRRLIGPKRLRRRAGDARRHDRLARTWLGRRAQSHYRE